MKVNYTEVLNSREYRENIYEMPIALGKTEDGKNIVVDLAKLPHLLVAGSTGSGKSVCLDSIIVSLIEKGDVNLILVDTKMVGFSIYNNIKQLVCKVCTEEQDVERVLQYLVDEMNTRYNMMAEYGVRDLKSLNQKLEDKIERIVLIIDEYADLVMVNRKVEKYITQLVQKSRACGIHIVISTQRPSADVVTSLIKCNITARIALSVATSIDSRVIIDKSGAENLKGNGEMIFQNGREYIHLQGSFISEDEVKQVVRNNKKEVEVNEEETIEEVKEEKREVLDPLYNQVAEIVILEKQVSVMMLQKIFKIGYNRSVEIINQLERTKVISEQIGTNPRKVIMSMEKFMEANK